MTKITIKDLSPSQTMDIVRDLRKMGYVQGTDFDFSYHKPEIVLNEDAGVYNRYTVFTFYIEKLATWFSLRYQ